MAKLKAWHWALILIGSFLLPLILMLLFTRVILEPVKSWWWFFGLLLIEFGIGVIIGVIFLIIKLMRQKEPEIKLKPEDAKERAITQLKYDINNPDNFVPSSMGKLLNVGDPNKPRTSILWVPGRGKVFNQKIDLLINLDESTKKKLVLSDERGKTDEEVLKVAKNMAEFPESEETEKITTSSDVYGRPQTTTERKYVLRKSEEEKAKEKEQAEVAEAM